MRVAVVANTSWYLYNFRLNLMRSLAAAGHQVIAIAPDDAYVDKLTQAGIQHYAIPLQGTSINPLREIFTVLSLLRVFRQQRIAVALTYTPKGNIYAGLAAAAANITAIPNVSGLGRVFTRESPLTWLVRRLYRITFYRSPRVFFQNMQDMHMFVSERLVRPTQAERIPGSGVDLERFMPTVGKPDHGKDRVVFLLVARMLWDKGVGDYIEAARLVKANHPQAEFRLLGFVDMTNPSGISHTQLRQWQEEGVARYLGSSDDVVPHLHAADFVVLPSYYREGVPRSLLEAASMAKPVIASDVNGCRDVVEDGITGFLCRPRDPQHLAERMTDLIALSAQARKEMGRLGREKMIREFDERIVIHRYRGVLAQLAQGYATSPS